MTAQRPTISCPTCGAEVRGNFCSKCGTLARPGTCPQCDSPLQPGDKFCFECGAVVQGPAAAQPSAPPPAPRRQKQKRHEPPPGIQPPPLRSRLPWIVGGLAVGVVLLAVGLRWLGSYRERSAAEIGVRIGEAPPGARVPGEAPAGMGVDPLSLSPQDQADRMFDRIMRLSGEGKTDSVAFFAPMAFSVYQQLAPLDLDQRFDLGSIALAARQVGIARAQSDTILSVDPDHLLGLVLGIRAARAANDAAAERRLRDRLLAVEATEWAKAPDKVEYQRHRGDVEQEIRTLRGR